MDSRIARCWNVSAGQAWDSWHGNLKEQAR